MYVTTTDFKGIVEETGAKVYVYPSSAMDFTSQHFKRAGEVLASEDPSEFMTLVFELGIKYNFGCLSAIKEL